MSSNYSISLTGKPEDYFAGASQTLSEPNWVRNLSLRLGEHFRPNETTAVAFIQQWPGAKTGHYLVIDTGAPTEGATQITLSNALERFVCGVLISQLPDRALPELRETLSDLYSHYAGPVPQLPATSRTYRKQAAKRGKTNRPPEIRIEE
jgi:hypothetical protein